MQVYVYTTWVCLYNAWVCVYTAWVCVYTAWVCVYTAWVYVYTTWVCVWVCVCPGLCFKEAVRRPQWLMHAYIRSLFTCTHTHSLSLSLTPSSTFHSCCYFTCQSTPVWWAPLGEAAITTGEAHTASPFLIQSSLKPVKQPPSYSLRLKMRTLCRDIQRRRDGGGPNGFLLTSLSFLWMGLCACVSLHASEGRPPVRDYNLTVWHMHMRATVCMHHCLRGHTKFLVPST